MNKTKERNEIIAEFIVTKTKNEKKKFSHSEIWRHIAEIKGITHRDNRRQLQRNVKKDLTTSKRYIQSGKKGNYQYELSDKIFTKTSDILLIKPILEENRTQKPKSFIEFDFFDHDEELIVYARIQEADKVHKIMDGLKLIGKKDLHLGSGRMKQFDTVLHDLISLSELFEIKKVDLPRESERNYDDNRKQIEENPISLLHMIEGLASNFLKTRKNMTSHQIDRFGNDLKDGELIKDVIRKSLVDYEMTTPMSDLFDFQQFQNKFEKIQNEATNTLLALFKLIMKSNCNDIKDQAEKFLDNYHASIEDINKEVGNKLDVYADQVKGMHWNEQIQHMKDIDNINETKSVEKTIKDK